MYQDEVTRMDLFGDLPDILTVHQVREALGIGRTAVYRLLEAKKIPCFKIGNAYKIPKSGLITYIQKSCETEEGGEQE